ncbi:MAG: substrate-binding domain-containing protein [Spirochaetaceae bacterium]
MNIRTTVLASLLIIAVAAIITAVAARRLTPAEDSAYDIVVVVKAMSPEMEFWRIVRAGIDTAAVEFGIEPRVTGPWLERDIADQIRILNDVIDDRPDGIILAASDYEALAPVASRAVEAGIVLVTIDSAVAGDAATSFIATDNRRAGERAGEAMAAVLPPGSSFAIVSHIEEVATSIDRERGALRALGQAGNYNFLGTSFSENTLEIAYDHTVRLLQDNPDLGGIIGLNETSTLGIARAVRDAGRTADVRVVGFDHSQEEIAFLEQGIIQALIVQKPFNMGYLSLRAMIDLLQDRQVAAFIDTGSELVTRETMYDPEFQQLLFPFFDSAR